MLIFLKKFRYIFLNSLLRVPWISFLITSIRFFLIKYILRRKLIMWSADEKLTVNFDYSKSAYSKVLIRPLTRSVIPISLASSLLWPEPFDKKLLIIGPRYESDYFLARGQGFAKQNITLVDHFSYSKKIQVSDAHNLNFPDYSFDVVIASWVLVHSTNHKQFLSEVRRVLKDQIGIAIISGDNHESSHPYSALNIEAAPYIFDAEHILKIWSNPKDNLIISWPTKTQVISGTPQVIVAFQKSDQVN